MVGSAAYCRHYGKTGKRCFMTQTFGKVLFTPALEYPLATKGAYHSMAESPVTISCLRNISPPNPECGQKVVAELSMNGNSSRRTPTTTGSTAWQAVPYVHLLGLFCKGFRRVIGYTVGWRAFCVTAPLKRKFLFHSPLVTPLQ